MRSGNSGVWPFVSGVLATSLVVMLGVGDPPSVSDVGRAGDVITAAAGTTLADGQVVPTLSAIGDAITPFTSLEELRRAAAGQRSTVACSIPPNGTALIVCASGYAFIVGSDGHAKPVEALSMADTAHREAGESPRWRPLNTTFGTAEADMDERFDAAIIKWSRAIEASKNGTASRTKPTK